MTANSAGPEIERLISLLARLPGLGPRSARRVALVLMKRKEALLDPLVSAMQDVGRVIRTCSVCGHVDTSDPCTICTDARRDPATICVVEDIGDVWALERAGVFRGRYHVLGGLLSALDGRGPETLGLPRLIARLGDGKVTEIILALAATVDGQATAFYISGELAALGVKVTRLGQGLPFGGELGWLDDGTLTAAFRARQSVG
ncbi:MAG TPA: recombination mediator RecR [Micropepsaceae bacterium]|nr:recombination mediator RecR [Micropepsaceae bacterium]HRK71644.1 recombination mediator RecR [Micropepsaceae bacterium]